MCLPTLQQESVTSLCTCASVSCSPKCRSYAAATTPGAGSKGVAVLLVVVCCPLPSDAADAAAAMRLQVQQHTQQQTSRSGQHDGIRLKPLPQLMFMLFLKRS
jgi:hypothetical protein